MKKITFIILSLLFVKQAICASQNPPPVLFDIDFAGLANQCLELEKPLDFYKLIITDMQPKTKSEFDAAIRDEADNILNLGETVVENFPASTSWVGKSGMEGCEHTVKVVRRKIDTLKIEDILILFQNTTTLRCINKNICEVAQIVGKMMNLSIRIHKSAEDLKFSISITDQFSIANIWSIFLKSLSMGGHKIIKEPAMPYYVIAHKDVVEILPIDLV